MWEGMCGHNVLFYTPAGGLVEDDLITQLNYFWRAVEFLPEGADG